MSFEINDMNIANLIHMKMSLPSNSQANL